MSNRAHELKIEKDYADSVYLGDKNFEIRFNDRGFQKGRHHTEEHKKKISDSLKRFHGERREE